MLCQFIARNSDADIEDQKHVQGVLASIGQLKYISILAY